MTLDKRVFYTGTIERPGHYFWLSRSRSVLYSDEILKAAPDFPAVWAQIWDGVLLENGKREDVYDGKVWAVPAKGPWTAFIWWDRSVDKRGASNSAFYVSGFEWSDRKAAFEYAKEAWPEVVQRQKHRLVLQENWT